MGRRPCTCHNSCIDRPLPTPLSFPFHPVFSPLPKLLKGPFFLKGVYKGLVLPRSPSLQNNIDCRCNNGCRRLSRLPGGWLCFQASIFPHPSRHWPEG